MSRNAPSAPARENRGLLPALRENLRKGDLLALFWEFVRFGWVGFSTLSLYAVEMWALARLTAWPIWVNAALSYGPCLVANYLLHRNFTFRSERAHMVAGPRYLVIQLGGMAINSGVLWLGGEVLLFPYWSSQVVAIVTVALWSYAGQKLWTFS